MIFKVKYFLDNYDIGGRYAIVGFHRVKRDHTYGRVNKKKC